MDTQLWIAHCDHGPPTLERMKPIENPTERLNKPRGGIWTSTYGNSRAWLPLILTECWAMGDRPVFEWDAWLIEVEPWAKIFTVETAADLEELWSLYPNRSVQTGREVDWEAAAREIDGIQLTAGGEAATCGPASDHDDEEWTRSLNLHGWDCESTLWLRWAFSDARQLEIARALWSARDAVLAADASGPTV